MSGSMCTTRFSLGNFTSQWSCATSTTRTRTIVHRDNDNIFSLKILLLTSCHLDRLAILTSCSSWNDASSSVDSRQRAQMVSMAGSIFLLGH